MIAQASRSTPFVRTQTIFHHRGPLARASGPVNVPTSIRYCRVSGTGGTIDLRSRGDYRYSGDVPMVVGQNTFMIRAEDLAGNIAVETIKIDYEP
jgi:hypothetical protein